MKNVKRANAFLWAGNVLLIVGIVAFALQFMILKDVRVLEVPMPISVPPYPPSTDPVDSKALGNLPNPLVPARPTGPAQVGPIRLIGTDRLLSDPLADTAYMELITKKLNVNAYVGEPIRDENSGKEVAELTGWRLKSVTPNTALFATPGGEVTLKVEEFAPSAPVAVPLTGGPATPWSPAKYTTKKDPARSNENMEVWNVDRKEVDWAGLNVDGILVGVSLEPFSGGGLKINTLPEGSFIHDRGLKAGDVVKSINGQSIDSIAKLQEIMKGLSKNATTLTVTVDRSGRPYTLQYIAPQAPRPR